MSLLSDRAGKTARLVLLPASIDDPNKAPAGVYRLGLLIACVAIGSFFASLVIAYYWRRATPGFWEPVELPVSLWISTAIILASSAVFEAARRCFARGLREAAARLLVVTACMGAAFLISQISSWKTLVEQGAYLRQNPYSSFFYLFTGLHAAHLLGGLVALGMVVFGHNTRRELVDVAAYYWHFLGVLWVALFFILST